MMNVANTSGRELLSLISTALCAEKTDAITQVADWDAIGVAAKKHAVLPLIYHAIMLRPVVDRPPIELVNEWKRYTISTVLRNESLARAQIVAIKALQNAGIRCAILKGTSVAILYPKPEMRALGDIDILVNKSQCTKAVEILEANGYRRHAGEHSFHIGFDKAGVYLELHYDVTEYPDSPIGHRVKDRFSNALLRLKEVNVDNCALPVLSESDQAIALLLHMERHMVDGGIGLRQLCDWCVFVHSLSYEQLHNEVLPTICDCHLYQFASFLTRICVEYFGLDANRNNWCMSTKKKIADGLLYDILDSGNIMSRELERTASSTFVKGEESSNNKQSMLASAASNLSVSAKKQFPICNKMPFLLPFFWIFIPARYLYRSVKGTRPKQSMRKIAVYAVKRKRLYRRLELFRK